MTRAATIPSAAAAEVRGDARPEPAAASSRWAGRGSWALLDQALFSGANWVLLFLLARWWGEEKAAYGAFVLGWQAFLLFAIFHNGVLLDPMLVYGPKRFAGRVGGYLGALLAGSVVVSGVGVIVLLLVAAAYAAAGVDVGVTGVVAFAFVTPLILLWWVARRSSYIRSEPRPAALAGLGYVTLMVGGTLALQAAGQLTPVTAALMFGLASVPAALGVAWAEGVGRPTLATLREAAGPHWRFGRWAIVAGLAMLVPERIYYFALPLMFADGGEGTRLTGSLQAVHNFFIPFLQFNVAICSVLTPTFVLAGRGRLRKLVGATAMLLIGLPALWAVGATLFAPQVLSLVYAGRYDKHADLLRIMCWSPVLTGITMTAYPLLTSRERPELISYAGLAGLAFSVTGGLWLLSAYGLTGAAYAIVGAAGMTALASLAAGLYVWRTSACDEPATDNAESSAAEAAVGDDERPAGVGDPAAADREAERDDA